MLRIFNSHENSSGYYRVSSYYLSKLFGDLIPLRVVPIPIFVVIAYWMIGMCTYVVAETYYTYICDEGIHIHTYIHGLIHTYVHTYLHTCIHNIQCCLYIKAVRGYEGGMYQLNVIQPATFCGSLVLLFNIKIYCIDPVPKIP